MANEQQPKRKHDDEHLSEAILSTVKRSKAESCDVETFNLLDFSDDVLLNVLSYCTPRDLKALSFCCRHLTRLCLDRSLWRRVDLRKQAVGLNSLVFYTKCIQSSTTSLFIRGLIGAQAIVLNKSDERIPESCTCYRKNPKSIETPLQKLIAQEQNTLSVPDDTSVAPKKEPSDEPSTSGFCPVRLQPCVGNTSPKPFYATSSNEPSTSSSSSSAAAGAQSADKLDEPSPSYCEAFPTGFGSSAPVVENGNTSPKPFSASYENYNLDANKKDTKGEPKKGPIPGCCKSSNLCLASINVDILSFLKDTCHNLSDLKLEYCNFNCFPFSISDLPKTLKILSLKGSKKTVLPYHKPLLFKIQDFLPNLEELDLSYCAWMTGHSLLLLSKLKNLRKLLLCYCSGLGECVAYASLSTRFGFKALEILDIRGTSIGDSEVSSFGSLLGLKELYLEPPRDDHDICFVPSTTYPAHSGLMEVWETQVPHEEVEEYINTMNKISNDSKDSDVDGEGGSKTQEKKNDGKNSPEKLSQPSTSSNDDDHPEMDRNVNVFYRSIVNVSYNGRAHQQMNENQPPNNNDDNNQQNPPHAHMYPLDNGRPVSVQIGALDVQVSPAGVQVGPLRLQVRHQGGPRPNAAAGAPEPGIQNPGPPADQMDPVEVQVGLDGVQVGVGGVRVDQRWMANDRDENVHVDLGEVRMEPEWIYPRDLQLDHVEVQVAAERPPDAHQHGGEQGGVQVGPIEVQVGGVSIELERNRRRNNQDVRHHVGRAHRNNIFINYDVNRAQPNAAENPEDGEPRPNEGHNPDGDGVRRFMENRLPFGFHVHFSSLMPRRHHLRAQDNPPVPPNNPPDPPNNNPPNNPPGNNPLGNNPPGNNPPGNNPPGNNPARRPMEWLHVGPEGIQVGARDPNLGMHRIDNVNLPQPMVPNAQERPNEEAPPRPERRNVMEGRVHVIYVDPGQMRRGIPIGQNVDNLVGWAARHEIPLHNVNQLIDLPVIQVMNDGPLLRRLDGTELVTDASLLRLGDSQLLVHVGAPQNRQRRPSRLEVLVCRGYRFVTDRSLSHLAAAAPSLRFLDVENCGVTAQGVSAFANVRPDCMIMYNCEESINRPEE